MKPLRIVHALPFYYPATQFGGPVAQLKRVCRELARRGHGVRVVTTDNGVGPDLDRDRWVPVEGYHVWYGRTGPLNRVPPFYEPMLAAPLAEALKGSDLLHLHLGFTLLNELGRRLAGRLSVPYIYAPRGCLAPQRLRARGASKWLFLRLFERRVIRQAAALHAVADNEVAHLVRQGADPGRVATITNGVDRPVAPASEDVRALRRRLGIAADAVVVLFLGQLIAIKGLDLLIDAVAAVRRRVPSLRLVIAGPDGGGEAQARARVAQHGLEQSVSFMGHVSGEMKAAVFGIADLFALASRDEGLPNAVIEACAAGLAVVITTGCNLPQVARHDAGLVVEPRVDELAVALERLASDPTLRRRMGANAERMARDKFSVSEVVDRLEALYTTVAKNPGSIGSALK